jgi:hypothetical protein
MLCHLQYSRKIVKNIAFQQLLVLNAIRIRIIAIDEAHLLLEHAGFRPDLCACIELLHRHVPRAVRLAVTSTSKISDSRLLLEAAKMPSDSQIVRCSFDRSNCFISIAPQMDKKDNHKLTKFTNDHISIFKLVNTASKPQAVVFVCSKKEAENLALHLQNLCSSTHLQAHEIVYFHSELLFAKKQEIMSGFASRSIHVVVSTSAFGAGVNFPCIRYIIHYGLPSSLTEYMHTISQGGRDGLPYRCAMYFSHKNIHEQIAAWMHEANVEELLHKWRKFVEIIKFVLSPKCRRALILPFFDSSYDCDSMCNSCDACALCDEEEVQIDIQAVARILLKVIREFQLSSPGGVMFSRVKDVITSHGVATKIRMDSDAGLISRGIAAKSGFPVKNKAIWSIAVNYMLYGDIPFLCENVVGVGNVNPMLLRKLVLTEAGSAWLERSSQGSVSPLYIRHPVELLHFPHSTTQAMFFPDRSMSAQSNISVQVCTETRACKIEMCERPVKAHGLCQKHYMAVRRAAAPKSSCNEANLLPQPSHSAANNGTDNAFTSPRILSPILSSPSTVLRPQPQRALPTFGSRLPESHLQYLQRPQACFRHEFFSSSSDEDKQDRFTVFGHLVQHGSSFDHEQMHGAGEGHFYSGFTEFNASNRVNRHDDCLRQVAGAEAVETGIHPLITRVQNAITQKMPVSLDEMECDADLRSAVGVQEHLITRQSNFLQNTKKPKSIQSSQFVGCSHAHFNTRNHFEMRQKISRGNSFTRCVYSSQKT